MMMGFGGLGLLFMLFFFAIIIGLAVWFVSVLFPRAGRSQEYTLPQNQHPSASSTRAQGSAVDILKQRYARGEITKAEYETMRDDILSS